MSQGNNVDVLSLSERMQIQQQENASIQNERLTNLYNIVRVQGETFDAYTTTQAQRYNTLHGMLQTQADNFASFTSTYMQHFPITIHQRNLKTKEMRR